MEPPKMCFSFQLISNNKDVKIESTEPHYREFVSKPSIGASKAITCKDFLDDLFVSGRKIRIVVKIICDGGNSTIKVSSSCDLLRNLYESMDNSDLIIKSSNKEEFRAHKIIVCARSEVLGRMFKNQMKENLTGILEINDRSEVVKELIRFIYCGADETPKIIQCDIDLYSAAERYELEDLKKSCLTSIYMRLEVENALEIAGFAKLFNLESLYSCCLLMIYA